MPRHELTSEERRKGAVRAAEARRDRREEAKALAIERLAAMTDKALNRLERVLDSDDDAAALRACRDVLDRVGTRTIEQTDTGSMEIAIRQAREQLEAKFAAIEKRRAAA